MSMCRVLTREQRASLKDATAGDDKIASNRR